MRYVMGLAFSDDAKDVVLLEKLKPAHLVGKWNGVGGKIEEGETPAQAMVREFEEETGVSTRESEWQYFANLTAANWEIFCFRLFDSTVCTRVKTVTPEVVHVWGVQTILEGMTTNDLWRKIPTTNNMKVVLPAALLKEHVFLTLSYQEQIK
jgi:8-oxo-dGTP diphosphatase